MKRLIYRYGGIIVLIKVDGKNVFYRDSEFFLKEVPFNKILKEKELEQWDKRLSEISSEEEVVDEIKRDMEAQGFILDRMEEI